MEEIFEEYDFFKTNKVLFHEAKEGVFGNTGRSLAINFIFWIIKLCFFAGLFLAVYSLVRITDATYNFLLFIIISASLLLISVLFYGPLKISVCKNAINMVENESPSFKDIRYGFKNYGRSVSYGLAIFFNYLLDLILLVVPFAFKYINSQFTGYILAENEQMKVGEAFKLSKNYMKGFKKKYVSLLFNFFPYFLLCVPTVYIYSLWLRPKFNSVIYCFYRDVKE